MSHLNHTWSNPHSTAQGTGTFDSLNGAKKAIDGLNVGESHAIAHIRQTALSVAIAFCYACVSGEDFTDTDDNIVTLSDALDRYIVEATDDLDSDDQDGEDAVNLFMGAFTDALKTLGVDDQLIEDAFSGDIDTSDGALQAIATTVVANLPDDGEPMDEFVDEFVFVQNEPTFDAMAGKHTIKKMNGKKIHYQGTWAIRGGKKVVVNKRMPNQKVRLTTKQKAGLKKARNHAFTPNAMRKRIKSFLKSQKLGLGKK